MTPMNRARESEMGHAAATASAVPTSGSSTSAQEGVSTSADVDAADVSQGTRRPNMSDTSASASASASSSSNPSVPPSTSSYYKSHPQSGHSHGSNQHRHGGHGQGHPPFHPSSHPSPRTAHSHSNPYTHPHPHPSHSQYHNHNPHIQNVSPMSTNLAYHNLAPSHPANLHGHAHGRGRPYPSIKDDPNHPSMSGNVNVNVNVNSSDAVKRETSQDARNASQMARPNLSSGLASAADANKDLSGSACTPFKSEPSHGLDHDASGNVDADPLPRRILQFEPSPHPQTSIKRDGDTLEMASASNSSAAHATVSVSVVAPSGVDADNHNRHNQKEELNVNEDRLENKRNSGHIPAEAASQRKGTMDPLDGSHRINNPGTNSNQNMNQASAAPQGQPHPPSQPHYTTHPNHPSYPPPHGQGMQGHGHGHAPHNSNVGASSYPPPPPPHHGYAPHHPHYNYNYSHGHGHHPPHGHGHGRPHGHGHGHMNAPPPPPPSTYDYYNQNSGAPAPLHRHSHSHSHQHPPPPQSSSSAIPFPSPSPSLGLKSPPISSSLSPAASKAPGSSAAGGGMHSQTPNQGRYDPYPHNQAPHSLGPPYVKEESNSQHGQQFGSHHPAFQPTPPFDRMPLMDIPGNSDSKNFDDLMVSPSTGMSNRGGGDKRRVQYDLHDQPAFNEQHNSPITIRRDSSNTSATRYCTPIVTGGNDRSRVTSASSFNLLNSGQSDQNYRPSPPQGGRYEDFDSHMRYYHRPYPTMRGGQSSPTRYDDKMPPSQPQSQHSSSLESRYNQGHSGHSSTSYAPGSSPAYATPVFPRGGVPAPKTDSSAGMRNSNANQNHSKYPTPTPYYDQHAHSVGMSAYPPHAPHSNAHPSYPPRHDAPYPPPHNAYMSSGASPYGTHPHPPPYPGHGYPSPYEPHAYHNPHGHMSYQHDSATTGEKKRRRNEGGARKAPKPPKRKKMYSDFVGVTYNKTHAKFQACITHYRKQHYLGRYKLACDAAKAYDQSAKLLKGNGWKINFQKEEEYRIAKEKEFREVEEKRQGSGIDSHTLRKAYEATFPTEAALREKLGLQPKAKHPSGMPMQQGGSISHGYGDNEPSRSEHGDGNVTQTPNAEAASNSNSGVLRPVPKNNGSTTQRASMEKSQGQPAVTPSPNLQNLNKSSIIMKDPSLSASYSPSANSLLGGTPLSMPGSSMKFQSASKPTSSGNNRDLDMVSTNMFQSPKEKMTSTKGIGIPPTETPSLATPTPSKTPMAAMEKLSDNETPSAKSLDQESGAQKGTGDLAAASALLTIAQEPNKGD